MTDTPSKVRNNPTWQKVYKLVERIYRNVDEMVTNHPNEEWATAIKLRSSAVDSLFYVSQAVGSIELEASKFELNNARKSLFTMQSMYTFVTKQKFLELEPEIIVQIDEILLEIDKMIEQSIVEQQKNLKKDLRGLIFN